jgi:signal peptidase I
MLNLLKDKLIYIDDVKARNRSDLVRYCAHAGRSMSPTLSHQDLLEIRPYSRKPVRPGDVILFHFNEKLIVHRVVSIGYDGIRTQGDNNQEEDECLLKPQDILGQVVAAQRGRRKRNIHCGMFGLIYAKGIRLKHSLARRTIMIFAPHYHYIAGYKARYPKGSILGLSVICFSNADCRLFLWGRMIGSYEQGRGWQIRFPFRLFINENDIPFADHSSL